MAGKCTVSLTRLYKSVQLKLNDTSKEIPSAILQVRDRAWFVRLYGEIIPSFIEGIIDRTGAFYLTCSMISSVDFAHY